MKYIDIKTSLRRRAEQNSLSRAAVVRISRPNPWRDFQRDQNYLFVHIPRTAGGSVVKALPPGCEVGHIPAYVYRDWEPRTFERCFKFAFVRNPWDRLVSAYFRVIAGAKNPETASWGVRNLGGFDSFASFVRALEGRRGFRELVMAYPHFRPQLEFLSIGGEIELDFIGRFERLHIDFRTVGEKLGLDEVSLSHEHKSIRSNYRDYYSECSKNIVGTLYKHDIISFAYTFD